MSEVKLGLLVFVCLIVLILGITWIAQGNDFFLTKVFQPKYEAVRRQTFEESKAYNAGTWQELRSYQKDYIRASNSQKDSIASIALHVVDGYDESKLPADLRSFVDELRNRNLSVSKESFK